MRNLISATLRATSRGCPKRLACAVLVVLTVTSCSGGSGGTGTSTAEAPSTTFGGLTTTSVCNAAAAACRRSIAVSAAAQLPELAGLPEEKVIESSRALCAHLEAIAADPTRRPSSIADLVASTATSLELTADQVTALLTAAEQTCPVGSAALQAVENDSGPVPIVLSASGASDLTVTYSLPDGSSHTEQVVDNWEVVVNYPEPIEVAMAVATDSGSAVRCRIALGTLVLSEADADQGGGRVVCSASKQQVEEARDAR